ncbi:hypothetical protein [Mycolicibacterium grossiae]|uniref:DUF4190 domain-containing protein n=1 Tax=Mycolicibacterium grossiae TaxID=1552759 RepID=A0A1E8Q4F1_9MYCO|nr:hypothetical protein [Mycolicibacterium grossiae]OFJ53488.1 hypothetical protein BEL07_12090 [Mycolicibacterium grossiae]QEM44025.1 hypothetical protein FZ046_03825 [Mycolicibacterium grossiae]
MSDPASPQPETTPPHAGAAPAEPATGPIATADEHRPPPQGQPQDGPYSPQGPYPQPPYGYAPAPPRRPSRVPMVAAWVGIVAGVVFIVAIIFGTGFMLGAHSGGGHRGHDGRPDGGEAMLHRQGPPPMFPMGPMLRPGPGFVFPEGPGGQLGPGAPFGPGDGTNPSPSTVPTPGR